MAEDVFSVAARLNHYKRRDIQEEIALHAQDREVATKYGERGFGRRPDIVNYPADVLAAVKKGATSFHGSEERWTDPLALKPGMRPAEFSEIRKGWDLVLDVDCKIWEHAQIVTDLLVKALQKWGIESISCKFSGNKGFHIGVPFESFPQSVEGKPTALQFPDGVHWIAKYLAYLIDSEEMDRALSKRMLALGEDTLKKQLGIEQLSGLVCAGCGQSKAAAQSMKTQFICTNPACKTYNKTQEGGDNVCPTCGKFRERLATQAPKSNDACKSCGGTAFEERFDSSLVLNLDVQLISARHLYRMPFSMHEKSGLVSIPMDPDKVMEFEREMASPDRIEIIEKFRFLDRKTAKPGEAAALLVQAKDHWGAMKPIVESLQVTKDLGEVEIPLEAVPEEAFPPCMLIGLQGMREGRKRFLFTAVNFLHSLGWPYEKIEERLKAWNELNPEPLGDGHIMGKVRYHKQTQKRKLPPNCSNQHYYMDIGICQPDGLCQRIKNPVSYAKKKVRLVKKKKSKKKSASSKAPKKSEQSPAPQESA